jgi:hypothetical protein
MLLRLLRCAGIIGVRHILREPTDNPPADARASRESRFAALGQRARMSPDAAGCVEREGFTASGRTSPTTPQNPSLRLESLSLRLGLKGLAAVRAPPSSARELSSCYVWRFASRTSCASQQWYVRCAQKRKEAPLHGPACGNVTRAERLATILSAPRSRPPALAATREAMKMLPWCPTKSRSIGYHPMRKSRLLMSLRSMSQPSLATGDTG